MPAHAAVEPDYNSGSPLVIDYWLAEHSEQEIKADLDFIKGMRPHHAGALPMSKEYLNSKSASSELLQKLAKGIITNQQFEIELMDDMAATLKLKDSGKRVIAKQGFAQKNRFVRAPMPGLIDRWNAENPVSKRDVAFAKAMIIHHQGALDMANEYLANPVADNGYLKLLCLDILRDQAQEIAFMEKIIAAYEGDPSKVKPSPIYGMDHMNHKKHGSQKPAKAAHHHSHH